MSAKPISPFEISAQILLTFRSHSQTP